MADTELQEIKFSGKRGPRLSREATFRRLRGGRRNRIHSAPSSRQYNPRRTPIQPPRAIELPTPVKTALMNAIEKRDMATIRIQLSQKRNFNAQDTNGDTALHYSIRMNDENVVRSLLRAGINWKIKNKSGYTALQYARKLGCPDTIINVLNQIQQNGSAIIQQFHLSATTSNAAYKDHPESAEDRISSLNVSLDKRRSTL